MSYSALPTIRAAALSHFEIVAREYGLDPARLLVDVDLDAHALDQPDNELPAERAAALLELAAQRAGCETFGLRMSVGRRLSSLGPVGLLMRDQPTLGGALQTLADLHVRFNPAVWVRLDIEGDWAFTRTAIMVGGLQPVRQGQELSMGSLLQHIRTYVGLAHWQPASASFMHQAPKDLALHLRLFGPNLTFDAEINELCFPVALLEARNEGADPAMARYAQTLIDRALDQTDGAGLADTVRRLTAGLLATQRCSVEHVASLLGVQGRTLQRQLADEHASFSGLLQGLRQELAQRYLAESRTPLAEVAQLLGFSSLSAFSRWHSRQSGKSPSETRNDARKAAGDKSGTDSLDAMLPLYTI